MTMGNQEITREIILVGCGAMAIETAQYIMAHNSYSELTGESLVVTDVVAENIERLGHLQQVLGYSVTPHSGLADIPDFSGKSFVIAIGNARAIFVISAEIDARAGKYFTVIHPSAEVSEHAEIGKGSIVAPHAFIGPFARIGANSIINVGAVIGHDVELGRGVIVSPKTSVNGGASCGDFAFLGAGTTVDPQITIGEFAKINSGTAISASVKPGMLVFHRLETKTMRMFDPKTGKSRFDN